MYGLSYCLILYCNIYISNTVLIVFINVLFLSLPLTTILLFGASVVLGTFCKGLSFGYGGN